MLYSDQTSFLAIPEHCKNPKFKRKHFFQNNLPLLWEESLAPCTLKGCCISSRNISLCSTTALGEAEWISQITETWKIQQDFPRWQNEPYLIWLFDYLEASRREKASWFHSKSSGTEHPNSPSFRRQSRSFGSCYSYKLVSRGNLTLWSHNLISKFGKNAPNSYPAN